MILSSTPKRRKSPTPFARKNQASVAKTAAVIKVTIRASTGMPLAKSAQQAEAEIVGHVAMTAGHAAMTAGHVVTTEVPAAMTIEDHGPSARICNLNKCKAKLMKLTAMKTP